MTEHIKTIDSSEGRYGITRSGEVWRLKGIPNFKGEIPPHKVNPSDNGNGYKIVNIPRVGIRYIHRLVAQEFIPNPHNHKYVGHKDHNKENNRVENLYWTCASGNTRDGIREGKINYKGRCKNGMKHLSEEEIIKIYSEYKNSGEITKTAKKFGISRTTLSSWVNKVSRKDLTDKIDMEYDEQIRNGTCIQRLREKQGES